MTKPLLQARLHALTPPWLKNGPINRFFFDTWVKTLLASTLTAVDIVILEFLLVYKTKAAETAVQVRSEWLLFLPFYRPDIFQIEMAISKLKANLQRAAAGTIETLWKAVGKIYDLFSPEECANFFKRTSCGF